MKIHRMLIATAVVIALTFLLTKAWLESLVSERLWTLINNQLSIGENPGLTSDIELLVVVLAAALISAALTYFSFKIWDIYRQKL